ncbi:MAG: hypothetical protein LBR91_01385 [Puniceicoccales bacterium]|jgi:hypothetical protein|nr:hypothetical protein [Puniceicoccales bacterium]
MSSRSEIENTHSDCKTSMILGKQGSNPKISVPAGAQNHLGNFKETPQSSKNREVKGCHANSTPSSSSKRSPAPEIKFPGDTGNIPFENYKVLDEDGDDISIDYKDCFDIYYVPHQKSASSQSSDDSSWDPDLVKSIIDGDDCDNTLLCDSMPTLEPDLPQDAGMGIPLRTIIHDQVNPPPHPLDTPASAAGLMFSALNVFGLVGDAKSTTSPSKAIGWGMNMVLYTLGSLSNGRALAKSFAKEGSVLFASDKSGVVGVNTEAVVPDLRECIVLMNDVTQNLHKNKEFALEIGSAGKSDAIEKLEKGLQFINAAGSLDAITRVNVCSNLSNSDKIQVFEQLKKSVENTLMSIKTELFLARTKKAMSYIASGASLVADVASNITGAGIPFLVKTVMAGLSSASGVVVDIINKFCNGQSVDEFDSSFPDVSKISLRPLIENFGKSDIASLYDLARDVVQNSKKTTGFGANRLGKKATLNKLRNGLKSIDVAINSCENNAERDELKKIRKMTALAADVVNIKLTAARVKEVLKVLGAAFATTATVLVLVMTFGAASIAVLPAIMALLGCVSTAINDSKLVIWLGKSIIKSGQTNQKIGSVGVNAGNDAGANAFGGAYAAATFAGAL